jgi:leucyl-tRNA synthetase
MPKDTDKAEVERIVLGLGEVQRALDGRAPKKVIVVPNRIVNIVA